MASSLWLHIRQTLGDCRTVMVTGGSLGGCRGHGVSCGGHVDCWDHDHCMMYKYSASLKPEKFHP